MKPFLSFLKMQLNVNYGVSALKYRFTREKKKLWEPVLIGFVILLSFLPLMAMYIGLMISMFTAGTIIGQPEMILAVSFVIAQVLILIFGLFYIMGTFYFSRDLETFVPLPLKPYEVVGGKFAVIMVNEYLTSIPILLPPIIIYGAGTAQGIFYWLKSLVLMAVSPVLPLTIAALIIIPMMRVVNFRRYKDLLAIVGGLLAIIIGIGSSMFFQNVPENPEDIQNFFTTQTGLTDMIGSRFPPSIWAVRGLADGGIAGWGYFLLFLAVCAVLMVLLMWISNLVFYKALLAGQEVSRKRKNMTESQISRQLGRVGSPVTAIAKREWKLLMRTPLYVLNGLVGSVMGPIIMVTMLMFQNEPELAELIGSLSDPGVVPYAALVCLGLMLFTAGMNLVASTALSREGQTIWIAKMLPVSAKQQVVGKLVVSYIISAIGVLTTSLIMLIFIKIPILWTVGATIVGLVGSVPMASLNLLLDVFHPKLVWNSEQEAMKQNMNGGIGMLLSLLVLFIMGAVAVPMTIMGIPIQFVFTAIGVVAVILGVLSVLALFAIAEKKYRDIEV
jgi:ABC-2 type transport system permease protein